MSSSFSISNTHISYLRNFVSSVYVIAIAYDLDFSLHLLFVRYMYVKERYRETWKETQRDLDRWRERER